MDGGWALVDDLISKINSESVYFIDKETLDRIVETDDKKRYSYSPDGTRICANQGHSIPGIKVFMTECQPPAILFHGTGAKYLESIMKQGIKPKSRLYVHLSTVMKKQLLKLVKDMEIQKSSISLQNGCIKMALNFTYQQIMFGLQKKYHQSISYQLSK